MLKAGGPVECPFNFMVHNTVNIIFSCKNVFYKFHFRTENTSG